jgi:hypothetical protein
MAFAIEDGGGDKERGHGIIYGIQAFLLLSFNIFTSEDGASHNTTL